MLQEKTRKRNTAHIGKRVKEKRAELGMTQRTLADALGLSYYTMISQIEKGYVTLPPSLWVPIAKALHLDVEEWATLCLDQLQPDIYHALFGPADRDEVTGALKELKVRTGPS